ncbi:MAG: alpha/beta family hydrolase [Polyangiales bacterium]
MTEVLRDGPADAKMRLVLAHGAGAPMDSPFMDTLATAIAEHGVAVIRFEFEYMAKRRVDGKRRGPDRGPKLLAQFRDIVATLGDPSRLVVGGKSMGGRIASMVADDLGVAGVTCFGYPFHPPGKPDRLRTAHLEALRSPCLIVQGTRDRFGTPEEVDTYPLAPTISVTWVEDGDHSLKPRKKSGRTEAQNMAEAAASATRFIDQIR